MPTGAFRALKLGFQESDVGLGFGWGLACRVVPFELGLSGMAFVLGRGSLQIYIPISSCVPAFSSSKEASEL